MNSSVLTLIVPSVREQNHYSKRVFEYQQEEERWRRKWNRQEITLL